MARRPGRVAAGLHARFWCAIFQRMGCWSLFPCSQQEIAFARLGVRLLWIKALLLVKHIKYCTDAQFMPEVAPDAGHSNGPEDGARRSDMRASGPGHSWMKLMRGHRQATPDAAGLAVVGEGLRHVLVGTH